MTLTPDDGDAAILPAQDDPVLSPVVRAYMLIVAAIVVVGGVLFFLPQVIGPIWPWPLTPFNARFLGAVYLAELSIVAIMVARNRWAPGRIILPLALTFTVVVTIVSVLYLSVFDFRRTVPWLWFVVYLVPIVASAYFMWRYRDWPPARQRRTPPPLRQYLLGQGIVMCLYGAGLLLAPAVFAGFWPWPIDDFHGRMYSAIFLTGGVGSLLTWRSAAPIEALAFGVSHVTLGLLAIAGLLLVDLSLHRVDWAAPGAWLWVGGFLVIAVAGAALVLSARRSASASSRA